MSRETKDEGVFETYIARKTKSIFTLPMPIIISILCVFLIVFLIFKTDNLFDIDSEDIAVVSVVHAIDRDSVIEVTQNVTNQSSTGGTGSSAAATLSGVDYYDVEVPYKLTCGDIGGMLEGTGTDGYTGHTYTRPSFVEKTHIGDHVSRLTAPSYMCSLYYHTTKQYAIGKLWQDKGSVMSKDIPSLGTIDGRYMSAIQPYFYNQPNAFWGSKDCVGQYFDVILTDGTVIPFIVVDLNSVTHVNKDTSDSPNKNWPTGKLLKPEYKYLFNSASGNCLELIGKDGSVDDFKKYYKLGTENHIAYYRLYKKKIV